MTQKGRYTVFGQKKLAGQRSHIPRTIEGFPEKRERKIGGKVAERKKRKLWENFFRRGKKTKEGEKEVHLPFKNRTDNDFPLTDELLIATKCNAFPCS